MVEATACPKRDDEHDHVLADSSSTSLGPTPLFGTPAGLQQRSAPSEPTTPVTSVQSASAPLQPSPNYVEAQQVPSPTSAEKALLLTVTLTPTSFPRFERNSTAVNIEVFLNGELVNNQFISSADVKQNTEHTARFHGRRFHRHIEKPWVYQSREALTTNGGVDAKSRWDSVANELEDVSRSRRPAGDADHDQGTLQWPSTEHLRALSKLPPSERFRDCRSLGIIDLMVIIGEGHRNNAMLYSMGPVQWSKSRPAAAAPASQSPDMSLIEPPRKRAKSHAPYANTKDESSTPNRDADTTADNIDDEITQPDQTRIDSAMDVRPELSSMLPKYISSLTPERPPVQALEASPYVSPSRHQVWPQAGQRSLTSPTKYSPSQRTPTGRDSNFQGRDSNLHSREDAGDEPSQKLNSDLSEVASSSLHSQSPRLLASERQRLRQETPPELALELLETPELCNGSTVSYAGAGIKRNVSPVRPGDFYESKLVVGMRFVVT